MKHDVSEHGYPWSEMSAGDRWRLVGVDSAPALHESARRWRKRTGSKLRLEKIQETEFWAIMDAEGEVKEAQIGRPKKYPEVVELTVGSAVTIPWPGEPGSLSNLRVFDWVAREARRTGKRFSAKAGHRGVRVERVE